MKIPSSLKGFKASSATVSVIQGMFAGQILKYQEVQAGLLISANSAYYHLNWMAVNGKAKKLNKFFYKVLPATKITADNIIPEVFSGYSKKQALTSGQKWIAAKNKELFHAAQTAPKIISQMTTSKLHFEIIDSNKTFKASLLPEGLWRKQWELEDLNLQRECADFYTAYDICTNGEQGVRELYLNPMVARLAKQFASYLDMAVGGELRHCSHTIGNLNAWISKSDTHKAVLGKAKSTGGRHAMWSEWKQMRDALGLDALKVARDTFLNGGWSSSFGGKKWGLAAKVLVDYLEGEINDVIFVDTVWSLQHNTS